MQAFVGNLTRRKHRRTLSPEFQHAFALEVLKTERLRIIALTWWPQRWPLASAPSIFWRTAALGRIWHGRFPVLFMAAGIIAFVLFEASILLLIARHIKLGGDVPQLRRYIGAYSRSCVSMRICHASRDIVHVRRISAAALSEAYRQRARIVVKILRGTNPADLPRFDDQLEPGRLLDRQVSDDARLRARMKALDELNGRCGRDTIGFVAAGLARPWKLRREFVSQRYTTRWDELLGV
jgi:Domain of unknown function (DUF4113)